MYYCEIATHAAVVLCTTAKLLLRNCYCKHCDHWGGAPRYPSIKRRIIITILAHRTSGNQAFGAAGCVGHQQDVQPIPESKLRLQSLPSAHMKIQHTPE